MNKRGELSLSIIVMAVIALLILVVLSYITLNGTGNFAEGVGACNVNEQCVELASECRALDYDLARPSSCKTGSGEKGGYCCQRLG